MPHVLILSSSLLTERVLSHTNFLRRLRTAATASVWSTSERWKRPRSVQSIDQDDEAFEPFPEVLPFKELPYNICRRINEFAWDFRQRDPSRVSMDRHVRAADQSVAVRALKIPAWLIATLRQEQRFENWVNRILVDYPRSPQGDERLGRERPDLVFTMGPFRFFEPAVTATAIRKRVPTLAFVPSWDNPSTKNRIILEYGGYVVWTERLKQELHHYYPATRSLPVYVAGAPQFDVFFEPKLQMSREAFCQASGLRPELPIVLFALGSPNILKDYYAAIALAERIAAGELGDVQMLVRPHPIHSYDRVADGFKAYERFVTVQHTGESKVDSSFRWQTTAQTIEWVNTFRHADVVANFASTATIDASICDRPVVNLDYDPEPGQPNQSLVKDINHVWTHFRPITESGGIWNVRNTDEMVEAVKTYLAEPQLHARERRWIASYVCGYLDGRCAARMANAVVDFMGLDRSTKTLNGRIA